MAISVKNPPTELPVTVAEAKLQCALVDDTHNALLRGLISAATASVEDFTGSKIMPQELLITMSGFPSDDIDLGVYPIQSIDSFDYDNGSEVPMVEGSDYWAALDGMYPSIAPVSTWPVVTEGKPGSVRITVTAGYENSAFVPENVKQAILIRVKELFAQRGESVTGASVDSTVLTVQALIEPNRRVTL